MLRCISQFGFVAALFQLINQMVSRKLGGGHAIGSIHTAAHVEENRQAQGRFVGPEFVDDAAFAAIDHFEVLFRQVFHKPPFSVPDRCADGDEIDT